MGSASDAVLAFSNTPKRRQTTGDALAQADERREPEPDDLDRTGKKRRRGAGRSGSLILAGELGAANVGRKTLTGQ